MVFIATSISCGNLNRPEDLQACEKICACFGDKQGNSGRVRETQANDLLSYPSCTCWVPGGGQFRIIVYANSVAGYRCSSSQPVDSPTTAPAGLKDPENAN
jgi:hypothetical protein